MKKYIDALEHAKEILCGLKTGVLLTTKADDKVNSMTISWGKLGIEWHKDIFLTYVRESRFTRTLLDKNPEFTINIPVDNSAKKILGICGTKSGRDMDKIAELGLTLVPGENVSVPAIKELPLTLECKVIYTQAQDLDAIPADFLSSFYPQDVENGGSKRDKHIMFYGEIVKAYIIE